MKKAYAAPSLVAYGDISVLTGTFGDKGCMFPNNNKTIGKPSDIKCSFIPITDCAS